MSATGTVRARWKPVYAVDLPDGTRLEPGDTREIPAGEAEASDHWEIVKPAAQKPAQKDEE